MKSKNTSIGTLSDLEPGQWVRYWHDTGAFGYTFVYSLVVRVSRKSFTVLCEVGSPKPCRVSVEKLHNFQHADAATAEECIRESGRWARFEKEAS